jgi:hypothetical protein
VSFVGLSENWAAMPAVPGRARPDTGLYPEAVVTRRYILPPASIPTTAPLSSRVKKPRIPFSVAAEDLARLREGGAFGQDTCWKSG